MTRGMIPGCVGVPCIVWVFPEEVTPYAKIVTVLSRNAEVSALQKVTKVLNGAHNSVIQHVQQRLHIVVVNVFLNCVLTITGGESASRSSASSSPGRRSFVSPLPHDLRKSKDLVSLVGDRNGRRSGIVVSCDPNAIIFWFVVDPRAKSSGDSNLVSGGSGDHVGMAQVADVSQGVMGRRNKRTR